MTVRRSRVEARWLLWRHIASDLSASLLVAVLTFAIAGLFAFTPGTIEASNTAGLGFDLARLSAAQRDIMSNDRIPPASGPPREAGSTDMAADLEAVWGKFDEELAGVRSDMPELLQSTVGAARYTATYDPVIVEGPKDTGGQRNFISLTFDPRMDDHIELVEGEFPAPVTSPVPTTGVMQVALSEATASFMRWPVGEVRSIGVADGARQSVELSGTFDARASDDPYWDHTLATLRPSIIDDGVSPPTYIGGAYVNPESWPESAGVGVRVQTRVWFPLDGSAINATDAEDLATSIREFSRVRYEVTPPEDFLSFTPPTRAFTSGVLSTIQESIDRVQATNAVMALVIAGPLGVAFAVVWLAAGLIATRRRPGLVLAAARGATDGQVRGTLAVEGLLIGLPSAVIGTIAGTILRPGSLAVDSAVVVVGLLVGLAPAALLAASSPGSFRQVRSDLGDRSGTRPLLELVVVALAAVSVALLLARGLTTSAGQTGVDPLLAATPLLLSLAGCVLALRVYPIPLRSLVRITRARAGLTGFLGSVRALRDPVAGVVPVLAMTVGVSVAVFSGVFFTTLDDGISTAARTQVGADLRAKASVVTRDGVAEMEGLDGVEKLAVVYDEAQTQTVIDGTRTDVTFLVVDVDALRAVQDGAPGALPLGAELTAPASDGASVLVSAELADALGPATVIELGSDTVDVAGVVPSETALSSRRTWALIDRDVADDLINVDFSPKIVLVDLVDGGDVPQLAGKIGSILGPGSDVTSPVSAANEQRANPVVSGLIATLVATLVVTGLLCALALVITLIINAPARNRVLRMLRILGAERRENGRLVWWELGPMLATAVVVGVLLGHVLPYLVIAGIDLRPFTGGTVQPAVSMNPLLTAVITGSFVIVAGGGVLAATWLLRRVNRSGTIGTGEEE